MFLGAWAVLLISGRSQLFRDPGTFWHTLTGDRILQVGFPRTDWLSFTFAGQPWIAHQWLGEIAMAALHRLGGFDALLVATTAALAWLCAFLFHRLLTAGTSPLGALVVVALFFVASSHHFHVRPQVISILLFAGLYARLIDYEAGRIPLRGMLILVPLFVLWANTHGAVVGGLASLGFASAGWIVTWALSRPSPVRSLSDAAVLVGLLLACALSVLLNPYGLEQLDAWASILRSPELPRWIVEHASLVRTRSWQVLPMVALYLAALLGALRATGGRGARVTWLLPLIWTALTFQRVRQAPLFAVAAALTLAELLGQAVLGRCLPALKQRRQPLPPGRPRPGCRSPRCWLGSPGWRLSRLPMRWFPPVGRW